MKIYQIKPKKYIEGNDYPKKMDYIAFRHQ